MKESASKGAREKLEVWRGERIEGAALAMACGSYTGLLALLPVVSCMDAILIPRHRQEKDLFQESQSHSPTLGNGRAHIS